MTTDDHEDWASDHNLSEGIYGRMLDKTREVANKALDRLRGLSDQLPVGMVEQVERLHEDPTHERRKTTRVNDASIRVTIQIAGLPDTTGEMVMQDHCPMGMAVLLPCPAGVGTVLRLRMPPKLGNGGWMTVEVKHCRKEGKGWIAGCELLSEQSPL